MGKKYEITQENIDGYVKHLEERKKKYGGELLKLETQIRRIQNKIDRPEYHLRRDLAEGVESVSKACGIPLARKSARAPGQDEAPTITEPKKIMEIPTREMNLELPKKKSILDF